LSDIDPRSKKQASLAFVWLGALMVGGLLSKALPHLEPRMRRFVVALVYNVVGGALTGVLVTWGVTSLKRKRWTSFLLGAASFGVGPLIVFLTGTQQSGIGSIPGSFLSGTLGTGALAWLAFLRRQKGKL
jgi:NhaP-type Na+/H+ or K+/H+ antiporter